jgi:hypothetical protein
MTLASLPCIILACVRVATDSFGIEAGAFDTLGSNLSDLRSQTCARCAFNVWIICGVY